MIKCLATLGLLLLMGINLSCGSKPEVRVPDAISESITEPIADNFMENAVQVHIKADPQLNMKDGLPHTLLACIYQLRDPNKFNQLAQGTEGISKLLQCTLFDPSVASSERVVLQPGEGKRLNLDRAEGAKYLAVVAGYYRLEKERVVRLDKFPIIVEKKGWVFKKKLYKIGKLSAEVVLGPVQIDNFSVKLGI